MTHGQPVIKIYRRLVSISYEVTSLTKSLHIPFTVSLVCMLI